MIFESKKLSLFFGIFILVVLILGKFVLLLNLFEMVKYNE